MIVRPADRRVPCRPFLGMTNVIFIGVAWRGRGSRGRFGNRCVKRPAEGRAVEQVHRELGSVRHGRLLLRTAVRDRTQGLRPAAGGVRVWNGWRRPVTAPAAARREGKRSAVVSGEPPWYTRQNRAPGGGPTRRRAVSPRRAHAAGRRRGRARRSRTSPPAPGCRRSGMPACRGGRWASSMMSPVVLRRRSVPAMAADQAWPRPWVGTQRGRTPGRAPSRPASERARAWVQAAGVHPA